MQLRRLDLKQFRCFKQLSLNFKKPLVLMTGPNGSGKTSVLEALYYLGYLRSFRAASPNHLVQCGQESFFLKAMVEDDGGQETEVQAGFSEGKKLVRINKSQVRSYKELVDHYRVVTVTEDDLDIIKGGPSIRRAFLDQVILLKEPDFIHVLRKYRHILENRNSLLKQGTERAALELWTKQLWSSSDIIQKRRVEELACLAVRTNKLLIGCSDQQISITITYKPKRTCNQETFEDFVQEHGRIVNEELYYRRSLFGIHLDDFGIDFQEKKSKIYASRGQQKLTVLLLKISQLQDLTSRKGPCLLLLDDFMTDFDKERGVHLIEVIAGLGCQVIFVSPFEKGVFEQLLLEKGAQLIELNPEMVL